MILNLTNLTTKNNFLSYSKNKNIRLKQKEEYIGFAGEKEMALITKKDSAIKSFLYKLSNKIATFFGCKTITEQNISTAINYAHNMNRVCSEKVFNVVHKSSENFVKNLKNRSELIDDLYEINNIATEIKHEFSELLNSKKMTSINTSIDELIDKNKELIDKIKALSPFHGLTVDMLYDILPDKNSLTKECFVKCIHDAIDQSISSKKMILALHPDKVSNGIDKDIRTKILGALDIFLSQSSTSTTHTRSNLLNYLFDIESNKLFTQDEKEIKNEIQQYINHRITKDDREEDKLINKIKALNASAKVKELLTKYLKDESLSLV